jgi:hypothetical protein
MEAAKLYTVVGLYTGWLWWLWLEGWLQTSVDLLAGCALCQAHPAERNGWHVRAQISRAGILLF